MLPFCFKKGFKKMLRRWGIMEYWFLKVAEQKILIPGDEISLFDVDGGGLRHGDGSIAFPSVLRCAPKRPNRHHGSANF